MVTVRPFSNVAVSSDFSLAALREADPDSDDSSVLLLESVKLKASSLVFPRETCFGLRMLVLSFLSFLRWMSADGVLDESDSSSVL